MEESPETAVKAPAEAEAEVDEEEEEEAELSSDSILVLLQPHPSLEQVEQLANLATSQTLRDFDDLFETPLLYSLSAQMMLRAWRSYDSHHLGMGDIGRRRRQDSGDDDAEDDLGTEIVTEREVEESKDDTWQRLCHIYTYLTHLLSYPEFQPALATTQHAFDHKFCSTLLERMEPKIIKRNPNSALGGGGNGDKPSPTTILSIVGAGGTPLQQLQLASVPASILASVGIGIRVSDPDLPTPEEMSLLKQLIHSLYHHCIPLRQHIRNLIAAFFHRFIRSPTHPQGVPELLSIYAAIVRGFNLPLSPAHSSYLLKNIMPLHLPNSMANELSPVLGHYHEQLVYVLVEYIKKEKQNTATSPTAALASSTDALPTSIPISNSASLSPGSTLPSVSATAIPSSSTSPSLLLPILNQLLTAWPSNRSPNSPKEVLLLHELEQVLEHTPVPLFLQFAPSFLPFLLSSLSSSHARVSERCLQLWQNDHFLTLIATIRHSLFPVLIPTLLTEKHWNQSVNKMRVTVLNTCKEQDLLLYSESLHAMLKRDNREESVQEGQRLMATMTPPTLPSSSLQSAEEERLLLTQVKVPASLSDVKYSDFVFGHVLGEGSFSTVRYAKKIIKGAANLPSSWPEYAVKIINLAVVQQQHYEANINREIEISSLFAHPNITRLIAHTRNAHSLYLVLEYAKRGDLFNLLTHMGSLSLPSVQFISAEILRGLEHIHSHSIVYGDLKPENVLIHQSGHVKLSDFGTSRRKSEIKMEDRIEGTEDYLAPEVVKGEAPMSAASDLWAFACVVYQMLAGRTPMYAVEDGMGSGTGTAGGVSKRKKKEGNSAIANKKQSVIDKEGEQEEREKRKDEEKGKERTVGLTEAEKNAAAREREQRRKMIDKMVHFESLDSIFPPAFDPVAKDLLSRILTSPPQARFAIATQLQTPPSPTLSHLYIDFPTLKSHPFFSGLNWDDLHTQTAPTPQVGSVAPAPDAKWSRRKNSIMWAPMPKAYNFSSASYVMEVIPEEKLGNGKNGKDLQQSQEEKEKENEEEEDRSDRLKYVGFKRDERMGAVEENVEEEEEEGADEEYDSAEWEGYTQREAEREEDGEARDHADDEMDGSASDGRRVGRSSAHNNLNAAIPSRLSSRATATMSADAGSNAFATVPLRARLGLKGSSSSSATTFSAALPPRPPPSSYSNPYASRSSYSSVPNASPVVVGSAAHSKIMGGNPTASALLARIMTGQKSPQSNPQTSHSSLSPSSAAP